MKKIIAIVVLASITSTLFASIPTQSNWLYYGKNSGSNESYTIDSAGWTLPNYSIMVGGEGTATFTQDAGTVSGIMGLSMGYAQGGVGSWTQNGGNVTAALAVVASGGTATYTQNTGNTTFTYGLAVGFDDKSNYATAVGGHGTYYLNDGTLTASILSLGDKDGSYGDFVMSGGTFTLTGLNSISVINDHGTFTMTGGLLKTRYSEAALAALFDTTIQHTGQVVIGTDGAYSTAYLIPEPATMVLMAMGLIFSRKNK